MIIHTSYLPDGNRFVQTKSIRFQRLLYLIYVIPASYFFFNQSGEFFEKITSLNKLMFSPFFSLFRTISSLTIEVLLDKN